MFPPVEEQLRVLVRGTAQIETLDELRQRLEHSYATGQPLRVKYGIDPTGFDVHLGHTVPLRKLRQFQQLGHQAVLIIGTATAAVGDPSGRDVSRQGLSPEQIQKNAASYLQQIGKIIDVQRAEVRANHEWFDRFRFADFLRLLGQTTVQRLMERDDFSKRLQAGTPIYLHECLYPLLQGWDSVEVRADVELGGTEQLYNLMVGRDLQRAAGQQPQVCITMPILRGTDGVKKMGKSVGNYIGVHESPQEMFGKTMRIPDELMAEWFTLLTDRGQDDIATILAGKPNEAKKTLAADIVRFFHGDAAAQTCLEEWRRQFEEKGDPEQMPEVTLPAEWLQPAGIPVVDLLVSAGLAASKSEARRKIEEGAVNYGPDRLKVTDVKATLLPQDGLILRLGRKRARLRLPSSPNA
ncbi:MAG: tyrosine--tRNA ligase [Gemmataceae bacterium]|nr:tyrosine--tRNA ligase [Gemmataceae bacterium]MDW8244272.1 tyrosine--tRNA ligase [Thermogemmata sp.]